MNHDAVKLVRLEERKVDMMRYADISDTEFTAVVGQKKEKLLLIIQDLEKRIKELEKNPTN